MSKAMCTGNLAGDAPEAAGMIREIVSIDEELCDVPVEEVTVAVQGQILARRLITAETATRADPQPAISPITGVS